MMKPLRTAVLIAIVSVSAACSSPSSAPSSGNGDASTRDDTPGSRSDGPPSTGAIPDATDAGATPKPAVAYPAGPYGTTRGAVIADLSLPGWRNPKGSNFALTAETAETIALHDFYNPDDDPKKPRALLLTSAAVYCPYCRAEAEQARDGYGKLAPRGFEMLFSLFRGANGRSPATASEAAAWAKEFDVAYPLALDREWALEPYYPSMSTPLNVLIDLRTMTIVHVAIGQFAVAPGNTLLERLLR